MITDRYFKVPNEFLDDLQHLSGTAVKIYMLFRSMVREEFGDGDFSWIFCSYDHIMEKTEIGSKTSIRKGILELVATGWIKDFHRGYFDRKEGVKKTNKYCISHRRIASPDKELYARIAKS